MTKGRVLEILENKVKALQAELEVATNAGELERVARAEADILETQTTIAEIKG
jgi:hypothetical protein